MENVLPDNIWILLKQIHMYEFMWEIWIHMTWIHMIDMNSYGMNSHDVSSDNMNSYDIMNSYTWWCWCFLQWLESPGQAVSHHFTSTMQKWLCHQPTQVWMGRQRKWLAWILAYTKRFNALEKEDQCHTPMDWPCNATELCIFIGCVTIIVTRCQVVHISLNHWWINPVWQPIS